MLKNIFHFMRGKEIKAVLFDMDGTLFDSEVKSIDMMKKLVLDTKGVKSNTNFNELAGLDYKSKLTKILGYHDEELFEKVMLEGNKNYALMAEPISGVNNCLHQLKENGLKLAICTNGYPDMLKPAFEKLEVSLDLYQGSIGMRKKPEPDVYLAALSKLKIKPQDTLVVEDSLIGISAALAAGIPEDNILIFDSADLHKNFDRRFTSWVDFSRDERIKTRH